jgi:hypothetical protein
VWSRSRGADRGWRVNPSGCWKARPIASSSRIRVRRGWESIQGADGGTQRLVGNVKVPGRGLQVAMPHENLDPAQIGSVVQQMGRKAVP